MGPMLPQQRREEDQVVKVGFRLLTRLLATPAPAPGMQMLTGRRRLHAWRLRTRPHRLLELNPSLGPHRFLRLKELDQTWTEKEGQGPDEGAGASTTTAIAASGSTGAEKKDISGCKTDGLRRPRLTHFPTRNGRRFNVSVYREYDWVEYSMQEDAAYCFACRHFGGASTLTGDRHGLRVFIDTHGCS